MQETSGVHQERSGKLANTYATGLLPGRIECLGSLGLRLCALLGSPGLSTLPERLQIAASGCHDLLDPGNKLAPCRGSLGAGRFVSNAVGQDQQFLGQHFSSFMEFSYVLVGT